VDELHGGESVTAAERGRKGVANAIGDAVSRRPSQSVESEEGGEDGGFLSRIEAYLGALERGMRRVEIYFGGAEVGTFRGVCRRAGREVGTFRTACRRAGREVGTFRTGG